MNCAAQQVKRSFMDRIIYIRDHVRLPHKEKWVLTYLASRSNDDDQCWPAVQTIADDCGMSKASAKRVIRVLSEGGLINIQERTDDTGGRTASMYTLVCGARVTQSSPPGSESAGLGSHRPHPRVTQTPKVAIEDIKETAGQEQTCNVVEFNGYQPEPIPNFEPSQEVVFKGGRIEVSEAYRSHWKPLLGSNEAIDLAIIQATPYLQTASRKPLESQLSSQLARYARDKRERDERYAAAAAKGGKGQRRHGEEPEFNLEAICGPGWEAYANARPAD